MNVRSYSIYAHGLHWLLVLAGLTYLSVEYVISPALPFESIVLLLGLSAAAALASAISSAGESAMTIRFSLTFILCGLLLLPAPAGLVIAVGSAIAGVGGGVAGPRRRDLTVFVSLLASVAIAQSVMRGLPLTPGASAFTLLTVASFMFTLISGLTFVVSIALYGRFPGSGSTHRNLLANPQLHELLNVPLALMLTLAIQSEAWLQAGVIGLMTLSGAAGSLNLVRTIQELQNANGSLASRITELNSLHAISRGILSTSERRNVYEIIERECRKIFDVDLCMIAFVDPARARLTLGYSWRRGVGAELASRESHSVLAASVVESKRAILIDGSGGSTDGPYYLNGGLDVNIRSAMAVPLIVKGDVIGILSVQSHATRAYSNHQLSVLVTIGQQAAVAIENARHYKLATIDSLTGFYTRDYLFKRLEEEYKRVGRYESHFAILMIDMDGFKTINDGHGHLAGDLYMERITRTIRAELREADSPCRYGGDEFCLLLPETDLAGAQTIAERIRQAVAREVVMVNGCQLAATASIGVAAFPEHATGTAFALLKQADEALYRAKQRGRDCVDSCAA